MLRSLVRWSFIDREWGAETLDLAAKFWFDVYFAGDRPRRPEPPRHSLILLLTGFPRPTAPAVSTELARRFAEAGEKVEVTSPDPDTLSVKSGRGETAGNLSMRSESPCSQAPRSTDWRSRCG